MSALVFADFSNSSSAWGVFSPFAAEQNSYDAPATCARIAPNERTLSTGLKLYFASGMTSADRRTFLFAPSHALRSEVVIGFASGAVGFCWAVNPGTANNNERAMDAVCFMGISNLCLICGLPLIERDPRLGIRRSS